MTDLMGRCMSLHVKCGDGTGSCELCDPAPTPRTPGEPVAWRWRWIGGDGRVKHWTVRQCEPTATWTGTEVQSLIPASDISQAIKERDALRAALLKIKRLKPKSIGDTGFQTGPQALFDVAKRIAREALTTMEKRCG